jgi:hypothetical protein
VKTVRVLEPWRQIDPVARPDEYEIKLAIDENSSIDAGDRFQAGELGLVTAILPAKPIVHPDLGPAERAVQVDVATLHSSGDAT